jgi:hypothetical protein
MNFFQRLSYFGFGVGLGCLIVYALLIRDRDFPAWLPEDRVLEELAVDSIIISPELNLNFTDSILKEKILDSDVLFRESVVRDKPCREYQLESEKERMRFKICDTQVELYQYQLK